MNRIKESKKILEAIKQLRPEDALAKENLIDDFLLSNYEVGLACQLNPSLRETAEYKEYIDVMVDVIQPNRHWIELFVMKVQNIFNLGFQDDEWFDTCKKRSEIAFLCEMSVNTPLEFYVCSLDVSQLDEDMIKVGETEGFVEKDRIPKGIPDSHWWWHNS